MGDKDAKEEELTPQEKASNEEKLEQLKNYLAQDPNLTQEQRDAEIKKARIALMRNMRSPTTPYNSVEDFSKQAAQAKLKKEGQQPKDGFDADSLNAKLS